MVSKWLRKIGTFLSTAEEQHAFVIGWSEAMCPWRPRFPMPMSYHNPLTDEYHYYIAGRAFGLVSLLIVIVVTTGGILWLS